MFFTLTFSAFLRSNCVKNLYLVLSEIKAYVVLFPKSCMATLQDVLVSNTIKVWKHRMTEKRVSIVGGKSFWCP